MGKRLDAILTHVECDGNDVEGHRGVSHAAEGGSLHVGRNHDIILRISKSIHIKLLTSLTVCK